MDNITESDDLKRSARKTKRKTKRVQKKTTKGGKKVYRVQKRKAKKAAKPAKKAKRKERRKAIVGTVLLAPLLPFKKPMKKQLEKKGVKTDKMKFRAIVAAFYNEFVSQKGNKKSSYEPIDEVEFYNDVNFYLPVNEVDGTDTDNLALTTATISTIVAGVISLFKKAKEKRQSAKKSGLTLADAKQVMTETDLELGKDAEDVEKKLEVKAREGKPVDKGQMKKYITYGVILLVIGGALYFLSKGKK